LNTSYNKLSLLIIVVSLTTLLMIGCSGGGRESTEEEFFAGYELNIKTVGFGEVALSPDNQRYEEGDEVTLTASPAENFINWQGDKSGETAETSFVMDSDYNIIANFYSKFILAADNNLYTLNETGDDLTNLTAISKLEVDKLFYPSGEKLYFTGRRAGKEGSEIYEVDINDGFRRKITDTGGQFKFSQGSWNSERQEVVVAGKKEKESDNSDIYKINFSNGNESRLTETEYQELEPAWAPEGDKILFTANSQSEESKEQEEDYLKLYTMDYDGKNIEKLTEIEGKNIKKPTWVTNGERIIFAAGEERTFYLFNIEEDSKVKLTDHFSLSGKVKNIALSPEKDKLVLKVQDEETRYYKADIIGKNKVEIKASLNNPIFDWSGRNGKLLVETKTEEDSPQIATVNLDTGEVTELTTGYRAHWNEIGNKILFIRQQEVDGKVKKELYYIKTDIEDSQPVKLLPNEKFDDVQMLKLLVK
jgi:TolB protein